MSNIKYIAITIGPVVDTLLAARKTREMWSASYLFSWIMKQMASSIRDEQARSQEIELILPYADLDNDPSLGVYQNFEEREARLHGAGLFPDRIIFSTQREDSLVWTQNCMKDILNNLSMNVGSILAERGGRAHKQKDAANFLMDYLNIHIIEKQLDPKANPILELTPILDMLELRRNFSSMKEATLTDYLKQASLSEKPTSFLAEDAFGGRNTLDKQTIEHLAVARFVDESTPGFGSSKKEDEESGDLIKKYSSENPNDFIQAHKYVAIVQADGDNVGKTIQELKDKNGSFSSQKAQLFSKLLMDFSIDAVNRIYDYGGLPVYAGGDDLLFFAPVLNRNSKAKGRITQENSSDEGVIGLQNIFSLLQNLDYEFQKKMEEMGLTYGEDLPKPTLSFGLSISYYKYPLYESQARAFHLMKNVAKDEKRGKHNIAFELRKHSGSAFAGILPLKNEDLIREYSALLSRLFEPGNNMLLSSVAQKLYREKDVLDLVGEDPSRTRSYIKNSFNESIHKQNPQKEFLNRIIKLVPEVYKAHSSKEENAPESKPNKELFSLMRSLQFLIDDTTA